MDIKQIEVPKGIHPKAAAFDGDYLKRGLPQLRQGESTSDKDEIFGLFARFADEHDDCMLYMPRMEGLWMPGNYAYEEIGFDQEHGVMSGRAYPVTHWDASVPRGRRTDFLDIDTEMGPVARPYLLEDRLTGVLLAQRLEHNPGQHLIQLVLGDTYAQDQQPMPRYSLLGIDKKK
jgi:hypothetical protein